MIVLLIDVIVLLSLVLGQTVAAEPVRVEVRHDGDRWQLVRAGQPYFVRGAGGGGPRDVLAQLGGNSVRTWAAERLDGTLDDADRLHLTVAVGIWLAAPRQGMNYDDPRQLERQEAGFRKAILRYKDKPAVLVWGIGNELESNGQEDNLAIYRAIDHLAVVAHELDPNHPTMAVMAEISPKTVAHLNALCPHVDVIGINSYGSATSLPRRYRAFGGTRPYLLTEFGPPGSWESLRTPYGAAIELTSTQKGTKYRVAYEKAVLAEPNLCVGSYAFLWGSKQEVTATWFGTFLPDGARLAAVDVLGELWSGKPAAEHCPEIQSLKWETADPAEPGAVARASLHSTGGTKVRWVLQAEQKTFSVGGDRVPVPTTYPDAVTRGDLTMAEVKLPVAPGIYRLFAFVYDQHGGAAVANIPVRVPGK